MSRLLPFPERPSSGGASFDAGEVLQELAESLEVRAMRKRVTVEVDATPYTMIEGDQAAARRVFQQLLLDAIDATPAGRAVVVTVYGAREGVEVEIAEGGVVRVDTPHARATTAAEAGREHRWRELQQLVAGLGAQLDINECPDGGTAYTVRFAQPGEPGTKKRQAAA
jgi:K+-sensing histidine kinase KdpD